MSKEKGGIPFRVVCFFFMKNTFFHEKYFFSFSVQLKMFPLRKNYILKDECKFYTELVNIARAEHVPYSGTNKATLAARIQHYRDTIGTLYRKSKSDLKDIAKSEHISRYSQLKKADLIDSVLYHQRVVKPRIVELSKLKNDELRTLAKSEGVKGIGHRKDRM